MATFLNEVKIIDLKRSVLDTSEMDELKSSLKKLKGKANALKTADAKKKAEANVVAVEERIEKLKKKEKLEREKGHYKFKSKVYTNKKMEDSTGGLDFGYRFKWNRDDERAIRDWRIKFGFELLTVKDPYLPEGAELDAEGKWVFGDSVLMKITLRKYAEKQLRSIQKSERAKLDKIKEFQAVLKGATKEGVPEADLENIERWKQQLGIENL